MRRFAISFVALAYLNWLFMFSLSGQNSTEAKVDTFIQREFKSLDIFPAISYSPETNLTLGAIGIAYFDLGKGHKSTPISNTEFIAVYTLNKQIIVETRWECFSQRSLWRSRGEAFFNRYPDRNYGMGNSAGALVVEVTGEGVRDTFNYLNFNSDRIKFSPVLLRQIKPNLFFGLQYDMEYLYRMKVIPNQYYFLNRDSVYIQRLPIDGFRSGMGFQLLFDNRDFLLNPLEGSFIEFNNINYGKLLGSDYRFSIFSLDARHYINTLKNQTLALRAFVSAELTNDEIPMRALSRVGGHKFIRGYFQGTYQDYHMVAFEAEYRLPFWREGTDAKLWQVWKRLGLVGFLSGAQVFHEPTDLHLNQFNYAVGGGVRILFNPRSRVNLRIDYAIGLTKGSDEKRQSGLYFYLGEAF
jgi:outer membrane protein assembly factor BamA